ncbi:unnamed protein product [Lactuca virosa]|uniref:Uncharacterized protein n=1 Tax=Lactuca virosa TaxID=75947 RepID=A0AAU9P2X5_9ASTR|nr:unnamed protein product [Lactuca virosa]
MISPCRADYHLPKFRDKLNAYAKIFGDFHSDLKCDDGINDDVIRNNDFENNNSPSSIFTTKLPFFLPLLLQQYIIGKVFEGTYTLVFISPTPSRTFFSSSVTGKTTHRRPPPLSLFPLTLYPFAVNLNHHSPNAPLIPTNHYHRKTLNTTISLTPYLSPQSLHRRRQAIPPPVHKTKSQLPPFGHPQPYLLKISSIPPSCANPPSPSFSPGEHQMLSISQSHHHHHHQLKPLSVSVCSLLCYKNPEKQFPGSHWITTKFLGIIRMDNQNTLAMIAGGMVYNSVICLLWFPGGLANIGKTAGDWVFLHADLVALYISMAVLVAGMTVGPTFWKKMEKLARKAMGIAIVAMAIAAHHIILMVVGDDYWLRLFVNGRAFCSWFSLVYPSSF